jgi:predicted  nucleic acid-binding Zn-ribbon protein
MKKKPIPDRIDRIEERLEEIMSELVALGDVAEEIEPDDTADQSELIAKVTDLRDEELVLKNRLVELRTSGAISDGG